MIRFELNHISLGSDSLEWFRGMTETITPRLEQATSDSRIEVSAEEAIAVTLVGIRQALDRIVAKLDTAYPDE